MPSWKWDFMENVYVETTLSVPKYNSFDFLTSSLISHLIQKTYANIVKFKLFLKNFY